MDSKKLIELLKKGAIIRISKKGYTETSFRYLNNNVYYKNKDISGSWWCKHPKNIEEIEEHFKNMVEEKYKIFIEMIEV